MLRKLKWMWKLSQSTTFILLLDKEATMSIPVLDLDNLNDVVLVGSQSKVLRRMRDDLETLITEHDQKVKQLEQFDNNLED